MNPCNVSKDQGYRTEILALQHRNVHLYGPIFVVDALLILVFNSVHLWMIFSAWRRGDLPKKRYVFVVFRALNDMLTPLLFLLFIGSGALADPTSPMLDVSRWVTIVSSTLLINVLMANAAITFLFYLAICRPIRFSLVEVGTCVKGLGALLAFSLALSVPPMCVQVYASCGSVCSAAAAYTMTGTGLLVFLADVVFYSKARTTLILQFRRARSGKRLPGQPRGAAVSRGKLRMLGFQQLFSCLASVAVMVYMVKSSQALAVASAGAAGAGQDLFCYLLNHVEILGGLVRTTAVCLSVYFVRGLSDPLFELAMDRGLRKPWCDMWKRMRGERETKKPAISVTLSSKSLNYVASG